MMDRGCVAYFEISPVHASKKKPKEEEKEEEEAPVLRLTQFTHSPKISFDKVKLGHTKNKFLLVLNPKDQIQELYCDKYPSEENGFTISPLQSTISPGQTIQVIISWTPSEEGNIRELIHWKSSLGVRSQTVLLGTCVNEKLKRKKPGARPTIRKSVKPLKLHNAEVASSSTIDKKPGFLTKARILGSENRPPHQPTKRSVETKVQKGDLKHSSKSHAKLMIQPEGKENGKFSQSVCVKEWIDTYEEWNTNERISSIVETNSDTIQHSSLRKVKASSAKQRNESYICEATLEEQSFKTTNQNFNDRNQNIQKIPYVPESPLRRQTYVKTLESMTQFNINETVITTNKDYEDAKISNTLGWKSRSSESQMEGKSIRGISCSRNESHQPVDNALRVRHLNSVKEVFEDGRKGIPCCNALDSPLRRQTYIKRSRANMEHDDEELSEKDELNLDFTINVPSTPVEGQTEFNVSLSENTPNIQRTISFDKIRASCKNLLDKLGGMSETPQDQKSAFTHVHSYPKKSWSHPELINREQSISVHCFPQEKEMGDKQRSTSVPCLQKNMKYMNVSGKKNPENSDSNDLMTTASGSSTSEYVTAPSTPAEYEECTLLIENSLQEFDCNKTCDFPTPKIGKVNTEEDIISQLLECSLQKGDDSYKRKINSTFSPDSLNGSNTFCHLPEDDSNFPGNDAYPHQRLSNGTVVLEDSLLHPDDLINIDEELCSNVKIVGKEETEECTATLEEEKPIKPCPYEPVFLHPSDVRVDASQPQREPPETHSEMKPAEFPLKQAEGKSSRPEFSTTALSIVQSLPSRKTLLNDTLLKTPKIDFGMKMNPPTSSDTIASLADFSFVPGDDPKRCSTVIKSPTFQGVVDGCELVSKRKLFIENSVLEVSESVESCVRKFVSPEGEAVFENAPASETFIHVKDGHTEAPTSGCHSHPGPSDIEDNLVKQNGLTFVSISPPKPRINQSSKRNVEPKPAVKVSVSTLKKSRVRVPSVCNKSGNKVKRKGTEKEVQMEKSLLAKCKKEDSSSSTKNHTSNSSTQNSLGMRSSSTSSSSSIGANTTKDLRRPGLRRSRQVLSQSRLMLTKCPQPVARIYHPNPFAAKNMFYDDRWAEKQRISFTKWLNFVLTPEEENSINHKVDIGKLWMEVNRCSSLQKAPSREAVSLKTYTAKKNLGKLRRLAFKFYHTSEMASVIMKLEVAIEKKLLSIRKDRKTHIDVGLKQEMLKLALSYNPLWLRIGLETVFGEVIFLTSNNDIAGLSLFIINRLLNCPDIARKHAHPTVPYSYRPGYENDLKTFQLKRFLMLVYFLDKAKTARLINHDPCLFNKESGFKASRDVLLAFSREFLSGVGDITKHLAYLGYNVTHQQTPLDEFDFSVSNIAVDLRCGIRLTRVTEILFQEFYLSKQLRLPAVSRLQKIHNVELALKALERGSAISGKENYTPKDIVDGHLEKTLALLWDIIFSLQIKNILSVNRLLEEIRHLWKTLIVKGSFNFEAKKGLEMMKHLKKEIEPSQKEHEKDLHSSEFIIQLLKLWSRLVCAHYGLELDNLTVSFADGRAFCYILHHYHPDILKMADINLKTTQNLPESGNNLDESEDEFLNGESYYDSEEIAQRLNNDKANFSVFITKVNELGGVPLLIRPTDMINTIPDERVTTTFLAYFCARVLDLSTEIKAARVIQLAWRKKLALMKLEKIKRETSAVEVIQRWWRKKLYKKRLAAYKRAAVVIQCHWRKRLAIRKLVELKNQKEMALKNMCARKIQMCVRRYLIERRCIKARASVIIQKNWKMLSQRRHYLKLKSVALQIQSYYRSRTAVKEYKKKKLSALKIQQWWRNRILQKKCAEELRLMNLQAVKIQCAWKRYQVRNNFLQLKRSTIVLQAHVRRVLAEKNYNNKRKAVLTLQKYLRSCIFMKRERSKFLVVRSAAIKIQSFWRCHLVRLGYLEVMKCTVIVQSAIRMFIAKKHYRTVVHATVFMQRKWRAKVERKSFLLKRRSAIQIQSMFRGWTARRNYLNARRKIILVQARVRGMQQRKRCKAEEKAAMIIQSTYRSWSATKKERTKFLALRHHAIVLQSQYRAYATRKAYVQLQSAAICIQKYWRGRRDRLSYIREINAIVIQAYFRGYLIRKWYDQLRSNAIVVQKSFRRKRERRSFVIKRNAAVVIQRCFRSWQQFREENAAAVKIQSTWKMYKERKKFMNKCGATKTIQLHFKGFLVRRKFLEMKQMALKIEHWYLSHKNTKALRQKFVMLKKNVILIQCYFRMWREKRHYQRKLQSVITIQKKWRSTVAMTKQREKYLQARESIIRIQHWFLSQKLRIKAKQDFLELQRNATRIQAHYRMWKHRKEYLTLREAVLVIQHKLRATIAMRRQREAFMKQRYASNRIKAWYLACLKRDMEKEKFAALKRSSIIIQSYFRMWKNRTAYIEIRRAIVTLQGKLKATLTMKKQRENYIREKEAACKLQGWFSACRKRDIERNKYLVLKQSATQIQSYFRMWRQRKIYQVTLQSVLKIQRKTKATILMRKDRQSYLRQKRAVAVIERWFAAHKVGQRYRKDYLQMKSSVVVIQRYHRMRKERLRYLEAKRLIVALQLKWKATLQMKAERENFLKLRNAAIIIQTQMRRFLLEKSYKGKREACVKIQSWFRKVKMEKCYKKKKAAAIVIQKYFRSYLAHKTNLYENRRRLGASIVIQKNYRMAVMRRLFLNQKNAALLIQRFFRGYIGRCYYKKLILARKQIEMKTRSSITIQAAFRSYTARKNYQQKIQAARVIQSSFRNYLLMRNQRRQYLHTLKDIVLVQSFIRGYIVRRSFETRRMAALKIQSVVRMWIVRKAYMKQVKAIKTLQNYWRATSKMIEHQKTYRIQKGAAITLQSFWRGRKVRSEIKSWNEAAVKIQSAFRRWRLTKELRNTISATILIQVWWRSILATRSHLIKLQAEQNAATVIQRYFRGWQERKMRNERREAAVKLQAYWRMCVARKGFLNVKEKIIIIQRWWRSHLNMRLIRYNYLYIQGCIILIQACSRGLLVRRAFKYQKLVRTEAAVVIQSWWRGAHTRNTYLRQKEAVVKLQRYWRGAIKMLIAREYYIYLKRASVILQSSWRARVARIEFKRVTSAVIIQRAIRDWLVKRRQKEEERSFQIEHFVAAVKRNMAAIKIQRWFRRVRYYRQNVKSVVIIQRQIRTFILRKRFLKKKICAETVQRWWRLKYKQIKQERLNKAATRVQALWRGYVVRKQFRKNRRMTVILDRLHQANANKCESQTIGNKTDSAIYMLTDFKDVRRTLIAVMVLDTCTRWSATCCEKLSGGGTLDALLLFIKIANRSLPHMQILNYILNILITCAKFDTLRPQVLKLPNLVPFVTQLMKIYYEKGPAIFLKSSTLLYILASSGSSIVFASPKTLEDLSSIARVLERKVGVKSRNQREAARARGVLKEAGVHCPSLTPEWSMKPKEVREFSEPLAAICTLKAAIDEANNRAAAIHSH